MDPIVAPGDSARNSLHDALRSARRWQELLSETERRHLLADIARVALAVGQNLYPERGINDLDIAVRNGDDPCPRERLAFLTAAWPLVAPALCVIEAAPHVALVAQAFAVPTGRARRVAPRALLRAIRSGDFVPASEDTPLAARLRGRLPRRMEETVAAPSFDTPENRAVKAALAHFVRDLAAIAALARVAQARDIDADAERLRARVRRYLVRPPWRSLPLPTRLPRLSATSRAHPHYRLIHDTYRRYRESFRFDWDNPLFTLPARETWLLYEYWGFFQVADALHALGCRAADSDHFALHRSGLTFRLAKGEASRIDFVSPDRRALSLTYNREFARAGRRQGGWRSRSHTMRPDITLERDGRLLILDPKFKTYAQPGWEADDIHQMHAYRDAIVRDGERNIVQEAWLLYAGKQEQKNRPIIAYPASTPAAPFGRGEVGALLLRPGGDREPLRSVLSRFLNLV